MAPSLRVAELALGLGLVLFALGHLLPVVLEVNQNLKKRLVSCESNEVT